MTKPSGTQSDISVNDFSQAAQSSQFSLGSEGMSAYRSALIDDMDAEALSQLKM
jgi:hypothetical protein